MTIDLSPLRYAFSQKPLVFGGKAMEYYGLRTAGKDIDLVVPYKDLEQLAKMYPNNLKDLCGDFGVAVHGFEIWKTIDYFDYAYLSAGAIEEEKYLVISLEKLLLQKAMAMQKEKYHKDLELVVQKMTDRQHAKFEKMQKENEKIVAGLGEHQFVERREAVARE